MPVDIEERKGKEQERSQDSRCGMDFVGSWQKCSLSPFRPGACLAETAASEQRLRASFLVRFVVRVSY